MRRRPRCCRCHSCQECASEIGAVGGWIGVGFEEFGMSQGSRVPSCSGLKDVPGPPVQVAWTPFSFNQAAVGSCGGQHVEGLSVCECEANSPLQTAQKTELSSETRSTMWPMCSSWSCSLRPMSCIACASLSGFSHCVLFLPEYVRLGRKGKLSISRYHEAVGHKGPNQ